VREHTARLWVAGLDDQELPFAAVLIVESGTYPGTRACADYVNDQTEALTLFVTALELAGEQDPPKDFRGWFDGQMAETLMTRAVDGFLTYLADLLAMVWEANPNALPAEANIPVSLAPELDDREALVRELAGRRVRRLSRKGVDALNRPFRALGFPLFRTEEERNTIERAIAQRDLIVHQRGIVDRAFLRKVPNTETPLGQTLALRRSEAVDDSVMLVETVIQLDRGAVEKWDFETVAIRVGATEEVAQVAE
jgi:hypothetical protein